MANHLRSDPRLSGMWPVEPVHDAIVAARLRDLRRDHGEAVMTDGFATADYATTEFAAAEEALAALAHGQAADDRLMGFENGGHHRRAPRGRRALVRSIRLRVGRALVAFGGYVEGPC